VRGGARGAAAGLHAALHGYPLDDQQQTKQRQERRRPVAAPSGGDVVRHVAALEAIVILRVEDGGDHFLCVNGR
jgi:hypothetical protein